MNKTNIEAILPLTPLQQGILYHVLESRRAGMYQGQMVCDLEGAIDTQAFRAAWQRVGERHAVLRTLFSWERRQQPLQIVRARVELPVRIEDWRNLPEADVESRWTSIREHAAASEADLAKAPLVQVVLAQVEDNKSKLLFVFHHIILDGWSTRLVLEDFLDVYAAQAGNLEVPEVVAPTFETFVNWLRTANHDDALSYFRKSLANFTSPTIPEFYRDGQLPEGATHTLSHHLSDATSDALRAAARHYGVTLNTLVVAAWALLLQRYCDTEDVVFGTTFAGRPPELDGVERTAGLFINTLPLRIQAPHDATPAAWLQQIQRSQSRIAGMQQTPLVDVLRQAALEPGTPLFESIVVFENFPPNTPDTSRPLAASGVDFREFSHYPLALLAVPTSKIELIIVANGARFEVSECRQLLEHLALILACLADIDASNLSHQWLLNKHDNGELPVSSKPAISSGLAATTVHEQIAAVAARYPASAAVDSAAGSLTYAELNQAANGLANDLCAAGAGPGDFVPLLLDKGDVAIIAMLAVMKAGAAYCPLDVSQPAKRLRQLIARLHGAAKAKASTNIVIADRDLPVGCNATSLRVDQQKPDVRSTADPPAIEVADSDPAYVMFTSGSTGEPKGVVVTHANLCSSTSARSKFYPGSPRAFLVLSALSTDSSVAGIYWSLFTGGKVVLTAVRDEQNLDRLRERILDSKVSHLLCVPSLYQVLLERHEHIGLPSVEVAIVAGESCPQGLVAEHFSRLPQVRLYNEYGPTEATVWATAAELCVGEAVSIGKPVANTITRVLDGALRTAPAGIAGELCIGGSGVAAGYLDDPQATAKVFIEDPDEPGLRLYRTGDRVVLRDDGSLTFLGRTDNQLKIRGYRVEPEEIEAALTSIDGITAAAVYIDENARLAACLEAEDIDSEHVRQILADSLPVHMVPQRFSVIAELPRTIAGKIDRKCLPEVVKSEANGTHDPVFEAPRNDVERVIAGAWAGVLGMDELSVYDNFFEVGGDSLLSIRILAQLSDSGLQISPEDFFSKPTIAEQAMLARASSDAAAVVVIEDGAVPCTPIQRWFEERIGSFVSQWNQCRLYNLPQPFPLAALRAALQSLAVRYDAFRLQFRLSDGRLSQNLGAANLDALVVEHTLNDDAEIEAIATTMHRAMCLESAPLIRFALIHKADGGDSLLVCCHHLVIDALSFEFLESDLEVALEAAANDEPAAYQRYAASYSEWGRRLQQSGVSLLSQDDIDFWLRTAANGSDPLRNDLAIGVNDEASAATYSNRLPADLADRLLRLVPAAYRITSRELLLAAAYRAFADAFGVSSLSIDVEGHGREALFTDLNISTSIGWFTSVFPISFAATAGYSSDALLQYTKEQLRNAPLNGLSYGLLRTYGDGPATASLRQAPASQVLFNYAVGASGEEQRGKWLGFEREHCGECRDPKVARAYLIELNVVVSGESLTMEWRYSRNRHLPETIAALGERMSVAVDQLSNYCLQSSSDGSSADDFPLAKLDEDDFEQLRQMLGDDN